jgi:dTMP kinase
VPNSILIAIEGIDGAGKTTQIKMLRKALEAAGVPVIASKEPTSGQWGKILKDSATSGRLSTEQELELFIKDRTEHVQNLIAPALHDGKVVLLDRYFYSTIAYQGSRGANFEAVKAMMESLFPMPDAVFILDIDEHLSAHRIAHVRGEEPNHFEERGNLARAREIFNAMTEGNLHHLEGQATIREVHRTIMSLFIDGPLKARRCFKQYGCEDPFHCAARIQGTCEWFKLQASLRPEEALALRQ